MHRLRAIVVEGQPLVRTGIVSLLRDQGAVIVAEMATVCDAAAIVHIGSSDLVVVGDPEHALAVASAVGKVRERTAEVRIVALVPRCERAHLLAVLDAGADAVVPHDADRDVLLTAIDAARRGEHHLAPMLTAVLFAAGDECAAVDLPTVLTNRERAVVRLLAEGNTNDEIGSRLFISSATVKSHLSNTYEKLGARNRYDAVVKATQLGLL